MKLIDRILERIKTAAGAGNLERISRLNQLAKRAREIEEGQKAFEAELGRIEREIDGPMLPRPEPVYNLSAFPGPIVVTIDFPSLGVNHPQVVITERKASATMRRVVETLVQVLGVAVLENLSRLRVNRAQLVSRDPENDFRNPKGGHYSSHRLSSTGYFILTHSSTDEKVRDLGLIAEALGLSTAFFRARRNPNFRGQEPAA